MCRGGWLESAFCLLMKMHLTNLLTHTHTHTHLSEGPNTHTHPQTKTTRANTHTHTHTQTHTHTHTLTQIKYTRIHTHTHTHVYQGGESTPHSQPFAFLLHQSMGVAQGHIPTHKNTPHNTNTPV